MLAGEGAKSVRKYVGSGYNHRQHRGFRLPQLDECRRRWDIYLGRKGEWPTDVQDWGVVEPVEDEPVDDIPF